MALKFDVTTSLPLLLFCFCYTHFFVRPRWASTRIFNVNRSKGPGGPKTEPAVASPAREAVQVASQQQFSECLLLVPLARGAREVA